MHTAVAAQSHQMQARAPAGIMHDIEQQRIVIELTRCHHQIDARDIHVDHASRAYIQVTHLAVSHLTFRQSHRGAGRMHERVREVPQQHVVGPFARRRDGVALHGRGKPPAIQNGQDERLISAHYWRKALLPGNFAAAPRRSSIRSNWLYLAMRSVRLADPVLICPALVATARSAMNGSSVSPERCETMAV